MLTTFRDNGPKSSPTNYLFPDPVQLAVMECHNRLSVRQNWRAQADTEKVTPLSSHLICEMGTGKHSLLEKVNL